VKVALVDRQAALDLVVLDPDYLDAEVAGEAAGDPLAEQLGRDGRVGQALRSSAAPPS
jgi:hypothetical protein